MSDTKKLLSVTNLSILAMLIALEIVLKTYLQISFWNLRFGFGFLPIAIAARRYGAPHAAIVAALGDIVGYWLVTFSLGAYNPLLTITYAMTAVITALFIHKKCNIKRIISYVLINNIVFTIFVNTYCLYMLYHDFYQMTYAQMLVMRLPQAVIMAIIEGITMCLIYKKADNVIIRDFR